ncbi:alpha/beta fold hydrolase [Antrihabitans sp. NCIMB 15449]|uniref:Alpha/beta fold hydrolase n=1 Tax=Antrihabitans spumae TaxID=3373370 RepID=A0ABW7JXI6_9NOCA
MPEIELSAGRIRYSDTGEGPPIVFVHGVFVAGSLWRKVVGPLSADFRCITPDWPLGGHTIAMNPDADISPHGVAALVLEFIDALDLHDVTLVGNDTGGAVVQLAIARGSDRVCRVVLTPSDSFDNFLPRSIRALQYAARVPGLLTVGAQPMRLSAVQRLALRWLVKYPIPAEITREWVRRLVSDRGVRRDLGKFLRTIDYRDTIAAAETLQGFAKPVLLLWPRKLPYFPFAHAQRWTEIFADATLVEIEDTYTCVSEDQPEVTAREIATFIRARSKVE